MDIMELSKKVDVIHNQLETLKEGQDDMQIKMSELYTAFTGNKLGQKGIIKRVETLENEYDALNKFKTKMIGIGVGAATVWTIVLEIIMKKLGF
jgi:allophanate hydrolase subunit 1